MRKNRFAQEDHDHSQQSILQKLRSENRLERSGGDFRSVKVTEPVCELMASEYVANSHVPAPTEFLRNYGVTRDDCSMIEVVYNFPPEINGERLGDFVKAFEFAVAIWESEISSPVPIRIQANFRPLAPGVLGSAGPNRFWTAGDVYWPDALVDQLFGIDVTNVVLGTIEPDINTNFSTTFGWYLGTDGKAPPGTYDFVTVVLHELGHGLGFVGTGFALSDGSLGIYGFSDGLPAVYDSFVEDGNGTPIADVAAPNEVSAPLGAYLTSNNLFNNSPSAQAALGRKPKIYAPTTFNGGSSYSHWDEATFPPSDPNSLMTPQLGFQEANHNIGDITRGMFQDHGWTLSQDCDAPHPADLSQPCRITGITLDPLFPAPLCDDPGVFSAEGGAFGPVGSHVVSFRIEGIDPFNQPLDPSGYLVKIDGETYPLSFVGYDNFEGEQYFYGFALGVTAMGPGVDVTIEMDPHCKLTVHDVYDAPECEGPCEATAGTLRAGNTPGCLNGKEVFLKAREDMAPNVPEGFAKLYVLTMGGDLVIKKASAQPVFGVREPGLYTIHTLVYEPGSIDLGAFVGGPAGDLLGFLAVNSICAALDVEGVSFNLKRCGDCEASAGTLTPANDPGCYDGAREVFVKARPVMPPVVPEGYESLFVLTKGMNLVIQKVSDQLVFGIDGPGRYAVHTFVYDPETFDVRRIRLGQTTGGEVLDMINSQKLCADLDAAGAKFYIEPCEGDPTGSDPDCSADAGTLRPANSPGCFSGNEKFLKVQDGMAPTVPMGYRRVYVLTMGDNLMIKKLSDRPVFGVKEAGMYTVHSFVYNSNTLNPANFAGQPAGNLLEYIAANDICASLDVAGVGFDIMECSSAVGNSTANIWGGNGAINGYRVYPNPTAGVITVQPGELEGGRLTVFNGVGQLVFEGTVESFQEVKVDLSNRKAGLYIVQLVGKQATVTERVILTR